MTDEQIAKKQIQDVLKSLISIHEPIKTGIENIKDIDAFQIAAHRLAFLINEDAAPLAVATLTNITLIEKGLKIAIDYVRELEQEYEND